MGGRTRKTANEIFARCCSMRRWWNELFRAGGWPWTGMEPEQRSLRGRKLWADERKRQLRRWPQAPLILLFFSISSSTSSSPFLVPYLLFHFLLLSIHISSIFAYILTSIRIAPHNCARLSEFFSFLFLLFAAVLHLFSCVLFLLRCFFFFIIRFLSLPPFTSSPTTKHVVNLLRFALQLLLAAHPGVRIAVIKFRRSLSMFA